MTLKKVKINAPQWGNATNYLDGVGLVKNGDVLELSLTEEQIKNTAIFEKVDDDKADTPGPGRPKKHKKTSDGEGSEASTEVDLSEPEAKNKGGE